MNDMRKLMEAIQLINENDIDPETGDIRTHQRNDAEFYSDIRKLVEEAFDVIASDFTEPYDKLDRIETVLNDIDNIVSLRASGRPYAPIHEADIEEGIFGDAVTDVGRKMTGRVTQKHQIHRMAMLALQGALDLVDLNLRNGIDAEKVMPKIRDALLKGIRDINPRKK